MYNLIRFWIIKKDFELEAGFAFLAAFTFQDGSGRSHWQEEQKSGSFANSKNVNRNPAAY